MVCVKKTVQCKEQGGKSGPGQETKTGPKNDENQRKTEGNSNYTSSDLEQLSDLEHVRKRSEMYIGNSGKDGMFHLLSEVVDNSIDEILAGFGSRVEVTLNKNGSITVEDNGRGIPVDIHPDLGRSTLEGVMTALKFGGKFTQGAYQKTGGLHGMGVTIVNFLSERCSVEVFRDGAAWRQDYERGVPITAVLSLGPTEKRGTRTTFIPDPEIFDDIEFDYEMIRAHMQSVAFLNSGVRIICRDCRTGYEDIYEYKNGLCDYVKYLESDSKPVHEEVIQIQGERDGIRVELALRYNNQKEEIVRAYANNVRTFEGGTHLSGFRTALTRTLGNYYRKRERPESSGTGTTKVKKRGAKNGKKCNFVELQGEDFREGLIVVLAVYLNHPCFSEQAKAKLCNIEVEGAVQSIVGELLGRYLEETPRTAGAILDRAILAARIRKAEADARHDIVTKSAFRGMFGKLRDCSSRIWNQRELFLVEGDSAGGSAEGGRNRVFQAILPLRGKVINAYKATNRKVSANKEIQSIFTAIGVGHGDSLEMDKIRYGKVVIMTDADIDGSHIRTLLLALFYRQMNELVRSGHIYVAQPPLYRIRKRGSKAAVQYIQTDEEMKKRILESGTRGAYLLVPGRGALDESEVYPLCSALVQIQDALIKLEQSGFSSRLLLDPDSSVSDTIEKTMPLVETRVFQAGLTVLESFGFGKKDLQPVRNPGRNDYPFYLQREHETVGLSDLFALLIQTRKYAEKNLMITRYKGLGEMEPEELRETTLDPEHRTLVQVTLQDAAYANHVFELLMGNSVEPRRAFIAKNSVDHRFLDI